MGRAIVKLVAEPTGDALSLETVKSRLRIDFGDDDEDLRTIIAGVVKHMDGPNGVLGRVLLTSTWDEKFERFPCGRDALVVSLSPLSAAGVTSVKYFDGAGVEQTLDPSLYEVEADGDGFAMIRAFDGWPAIDTRRMLPITVRYAVGYGDDEAELPANLVNALILHASALYEHRDGIIPGSFAVTPLGYDDLIYQYARPVA